MHKINPALLPLALPVDSLVDDASNARRHSDRNIDAIARSLDQFGQRKPIVVQRDGMIVRAGNGTLEAVRRLGWSEVAVVLVDEDSNSARAFAIADNRTAELAEWDERALSAVLRDLDAEWEEFDAHMLGFEEAEVAKLIGDFASLDDAEQVADFSAPGDTEHNAKKAKRTKPEADQPPDPPAPDSAAVQAVQLFLLPEIRDGFLLQVSALAAAYKTENLTDTVLRVVADAHANLTAKVAR
jgi:ParB-like chromosome segregation protein Spo0J